MMASKLFEHCIEHNYYTELPDLINPYLAILTICAIFDPDNIKMIFQAIFKSLSGNDIIENLNKYTSSAVNISYNYMPFENLLDRFIAYFDHVNFQRPDYKTTDAQLAEKLSTITEEEFIKPYLDIMNIDIDYKSMARTLLLYKINAKCLSLANTHNDILASYLPTTLYAPLLSFNRAVNQKGAFFYQWYSSKKVHKIDYSYAFVIKSEAKKKIIKDLRVFGVTRENIYYDYDNIAREVCDIL
ncbi:hypothetical protein AGMMS49992_33480 [Clostridia bacterium]|nr:hypothetical protein AGMMS49992_33480 [Clostridia bacterium]